MDAIDLLKQEHRSIEWVFLAYDGTVSAEQRRALVERLGVDLSAHTDLEEDIVYPIAERLGLDDVAGSRAEHMAERRTLRRLLDLATGDPAEGSLVAQLRREVDYHVQREETDLLPALRAALDVPALDDLTRRLREARAAQADDASSSLDEVMPPTVVVGRRSGIFARLRGRARGGSRV